MNATDVGFGLVALLMAVPTAYLVKLSVEARRRPQAWVTLFLLAMMAEMWVGAALYARSPSSTALVEALAAMGALMAATVVVVFVALLRGRPSTDPTEPPAPLLEPPGWYRGIAVALVLLSEGLMAYAFAVATATPLLSAGASGGIGGVASVVVSPWFVFPMGAEMGIATILLWSRLSPALRIILPLQAGIMLLTPTAVASSSWLVGSIVLGSVGMIALIVFAMEHIYRHREIPTALGGYLLQILGAYAAMMVGLLLWLVYGTPVVLAASVVLEMVVYFGAVLLPDRFRSGDRFSWQLRPAWAFALLGLVFVGELFMGAVLDLEIQPAQFSGAFFVLPLAGAPLVVVQNSLMNGFWFFATVAGSTWFLAMMGTEMGVLVLFKLRETKSLETRVRLGLMLASYAAFAVFFPSVYYAAVFPNAPGGATVPFLGWSMGIGSAPLGPSVFLVVFVTYAITGVLVVLFGRRVICSTFCTAALMYQGTTIDSMKSFNRTAPVGRKYLGSRFSQAYSVTTGVTLGSLVGASFVSYFDQVGVLHLTIAGADPTAFLFALYFGVLWYVMFVTIPYTGTYNCVTMGWCYTGTVAQAFQKVSFFKLKVRSKDVCKACTTLDCAKSCPVGLVDMPGHFRTKGEFRSTKCCGVGDCVGACPYGNLYIHDVRHWVRRRLGLPDSVDRGVPIPMARARPSAIQGATETMGGSAR
ncbi:MAG: 4Fe-4S binding protein [Candidatus Lutacidiplasmatales archaeon]